MGRLTWWKLIEERRWQWWDRGEGEGRRESGAAGESEDGW